MQGMFFIFLLVFVVFFVAMTIMLEYHWRRYATRAKILLSMRVLYYIGSLFFLLMMGAATMAIV